MTIRRHAIFVFAAAASVAGERRAGAMVQLGRPASRRRFILMPSPRADSLMPSQVAPNTYVIHRPDERAEARHVIARSRASKRGRAGCKAPAQQSRSGLDRGIAQAPARRASGRQHHQVVQEKPIVRETTRYVDDPPRVVERRRYADGQPGLVRRRSGLPLRKLPPARTLFDAMAVKSAAMRNA